MANAKTLRSLLQRSTGALASMVRHLPRDPRGVPARLASVPLTPQASVHVVQWHGQEFLLACTAQQVTVLSQRPADDREPS